MGLPFYITQNMTFIVLMVALIGFPLSWISDAVLKDMGFGVLINYVFILIGSYLGALVCFFYFSSSVPVLSTPVFATISAALGAVIVLLVACWIKRLILDS
jgi:uncharacterized membrane protein YeaQ/YmgE (transglycosylase-associated protein family)